MIYIMEFDADVISHAGRLVLEYYKENPTDTSARKFLEEITLQTKTSFSLPKAPEPEKASKIILPRGSEFNPYASMYGYYEGMDIPGDY